VMLLSSLVQLQSKYTVLVVELVIFLQEQFCFVELVAHTSDAEVLFVLLELFLVELV